mmetsp:Transcript_2896/g.4713  ORF Transcript_2896/g.4713 Transcript_2896/m.4713 type:complete len:119 (-) Transcript_2896:248-604(-)
MEVGFQSDRLGLLQSDGDVAFVLTVSSYEPHSSNLVLVRTHWLQTILNRPANPEIHKVVSFFVPEVLDEQEHQMHRLSTNSSRSLDDLAPRTPSGGRETGPRMARVSRWMSAPTRIPD